MLLPIHLSIMMVMMMMMKHSAMKRLLTGGKVVDKVQLNKSRGTKLSRLMLRRSGVLLLKQYAMQIVFVIR